MRAAAILGLALIAGACAPATGPVVATAQDRAAAEAFAEDSIAVRFPAYPVAARAPVADCVVSNATDNEVRLLAGQVSGTTAKSRRTLAISIAARSATKACFTSNNVPPLG